MPKDYAKLNRPIKRKKSSFKSILLVAILVFILGGILYTFSRGFSILNVENSPHSLLPENKTKKELKKPRFEFYTMLSKETVPVTTTTESTNRPIKVSPSPKKVLIVQDSANTEEIKPGIAPTGVPNIPVEHAGNRVKSMAPTKIITQEEPKTPPPIKAAPVISSQEAKPKAVTSPSGYLTVAIVNSLQATDSLKAQLSMMGLDTHVAGVRGPNGNMLYRVSIGPFKTEADAVHAQKLLQSSGIR